MSSGTGSSDRAQRRAVLPAAAAAAKPVLCGGEILLDFLSRNPGRGLGGTTLFEKRPGGSIFNVAVGLRRLGVPASLLTKLGGDEFGRQLRDTLVDEQLGTECLEEDPRLKTTLSFVALNERGKPEFRFYRDHAADTRLTAAETEHIDPRAYSLYHFGSIALLEEPAADAYLNLFARFHEAGVPTSFDPNVRSSLIGDRGAFLRMFDEICGMADIIKMSDEDLQYVTGTTDVGRGLRKIPGRTGTLTCVTLGRDGALVATGGEVRHVPTFSGVHVVDTTGCGDAFMAAILTGLLNSGGPAGLPMARLAEIVTFANATATIVATRYGASNAMPHREEVEAFLDAPPEEPPDQAGQVPGP